MCPRCQKAIDANARFCPSCGHAIAATSLKFGDYETTAVIGQGGMGKVYRAVQPKLNRSVCIKTLLPEFASDSPVARRFENEATTIAALVHPNIVSVFDVGTTTEGTPYIVMEYVDGRTLRAVLRDEAPVPVDRAVRIIDQVLAALGEAHTRNIMHRDLKPANVMVQAMRDGSELCKVLDFGIARSMDEAHGERLTGTGMVLGTPGYMAPEQISGEEYDHRIDLYAAGVMLYELITGQRVYKAPNEAELMKKTLLETPAPPSTRTSQQIPAQLDAICLKALSREPRDRYANSSEFRDALAQLIRPTSAPSAVFAAPSTEFTPIAVTIDGEATTNSRALLSALLSANDEWERKRLVTQFERSVGEHLMNAQFDMVRAALTTLQGEIKERGSNESVRMIVEAIRTASLAMLTQLLEWLGDDQQRAPTLWLLRVLGRATIPIYLARLPTIPAASQRLLLGVVRALDPELQVVPTGLKGLPSEVVKTVLLSCREWANDKAAHLFATQLQSAEPTVRHIALECLDESTAFRLSVIIRQRLHDPVSNVRAEALKWVIRLHDDGAVRDLTKLLDRASIMPAERRLAWRALGQLKTEEAISTLVWALRNAHELEHVAELATLLVRTRNPRAIEQVKALAAAAGPQFKLKRLYDEALREA